MPVVTLTEKQYAKLSKKKLAQVVVLHQWGCPDCGSDNDDYDEPYGQLVALKCKECGKVFRVE